MSCFHFSPSNFHTNTPLSVCSDHQLQMTKGENNKVFKTAAGSKHDEYKKGLWDVEEDKILKDYVTAHGTGHWNRIAKKTGLKRCGKSCRLRWMNYLSSNVKHDNFSEEEEDLIIRMHRLVGNRWSLIAKRVPGRTDNQVKNYWNTHLSKKQLLLGPKPTNTTTTADTEGSVCPKADHSKIDHHHTIFQVEKATNYTGDELFVFSYHEKELLDDPISFLMDDHDYWFQDLKTSSSSLTF